MNRPVRRTPNPCGKCGFTLHNPVAILSVSNVGMYDDARYPGRLIVTLRRHYEHLDELRAETTNMFMADVQKCSRILRKLEGVTRVNVAILGNRESHVHAHVIPRYAGEVNSDRAPWDGAPAHEPLGEQRRDATVALLKSMFWAESSVGSIES